MARSQLFPLNPALLPLPLFLYIFPVNASICCKVSLPVLHDSIFFRATTMLPSSSKDSRGRCQTSKARAPVRGAVHGAKRLQFSDTAAELVDPKLTAKGCKEAQGVCEWAAATLPGHAEVLFVSPM